MNTTSTCWSAIKCTPRICQKGDETQPLYLPRHWTQGTVLNDCIIAGFPPNSVTVDLGSHSWRRLYNNTRQYLPRHWTQGTVLNDCIIAGFPPNSVTVDLGSHSWRRFAGRIAADSTTGSNAISISSKTWRRPPVFLNHKTRLHSTDSVLMTYSRLLNLSVELLQKQTKQLPLYHWAT